MQILSHAKAALNNFDKAIELAPSDGLYWLGRASLLDEFSTWQKTHEMADLPPGLAEITVHRLRTDYAKAMQLAAAGDAEDARATDPVMAGAEAMPSYEAARSLVRLRQVDPTLTPQEKEDVVKAKANVEKLKFFRGVITPIVFSLQPAAHLADHLAPDVTVDFDLRGYGPRDQWPWIKPDLGLLVWDPRHAGCITGAAQLFGTYSFQIFRANGYDALAALDDNGDGKLAGEELQGISVWFDLNSNGISDPGEVTPLREIGVSSLSVDSAGHDGVHLKNPGGITMTDGRVLPTWDWVVEPRGRVCAPEAFKTK